MVPVLLFGLVGIAGLAVVFRMFGDESDFASDDPDPEEEAPGGPAQETSDSDQAAASDPQSETGESAGDKG